MNYTDEIKKLLDMNIVGKNTPAAIYGRVSTRNESQKDSCENQVKTAKEFIKSHASLSLADEMIFVDDGFSGKSVTKRKEYQRLMKAINNDEVKVVIVKTTSRLFRSVPEATNFMQTMIKHHVTLYTLVDNKIWDFQKDELMFIFESVINAATSRAQHDAGINAQERRVKDKKLLPKDIVSGFMWDKEKKDIVPDPSCCNYIKDIFETYAYNNGSPTSIAKKLEKEGKSFPKHKRDPITRESYIVQKYLSPNDITRIITNRKYIGEFRINTKKSIYIPGAESEREKIDPEDQTVIYRPDLALIETDLFELVQRIHNNRIHFQIKNDRKIKQEYFKGTHTFAAKIFCSACGKPYQYGFTDRKQMNPVYRIKNHSSCFSSIRRITESDIEEITRQALKKVIDQQSQVCTVLEQVLTDAVKASHNNVDEIKNLERQRADKQKEVENLTEAIGKGFLKGAALDTFLNRINDITEEINRLSEIITEKSNNQLDDNYVTDKIASIKASIDDLKNFSVIDRSRVMNYVERINMMPNGDIEIVLKSGQMPLWSCKNGTYIR